MNDDKLKALAARVASIRREADSIAAESDDFPALERNAARIQATVRVMEINLGIFSDEKQGMES